MAWLKFSRQAKKGAKSGATAVELAFVAPIFFLILFGIVETGVVYIGQAWLTYATRDVAREVRTGQVQAANLDATQFRQKVCTKLTPMFPCDTNLMISVKPFKDFPTANSNYGKVLSGGELADQNSFSAGQACEVVLIRTFYTWKVQTPLLSAFLANMNNGRRLLSAADAFRNEPFSSGASGC